MLPKDARTATPSRRDEILNVASELFGQHGVQAVTTRQIAQVVGISQPSIYAHFPSIQAIQDEVGARSFASLEQANAGTARESPEAQLRGAIRRYLDFGMAHPQAYRIAFMMEHATAVGKSKAQDMRSFAAKDHPGLRAFGHLLRIVTLNRPDLSAATIQIRSQCLWATLHGLVSLLLARPFFPWADRDGLLDAHCKLAWDMVFV